MFCPALDLKNAYHLVQQNRMISEKLRVLKNTFHLVQQDGMFSEKVRDSYFQKVSFTFSQKESHSVTPDEIFS